MGFQEEYAKLRKKRLDEEEAKVDSNLGKDKIAPLYQNKTVGFFNEVAPVRGATLSKRQEKEEKRTWFDKGAFDDGYQFGDVTKTILGTISDVAEDVGAGIIGMGEKVWDTAYQLGAYSYGGLKQVNPGSPYPVYSFDMEEREKTKKEAAEYIKKDLYDEEAISKKIIGAPVRWMGIDSEESSLLGEKTDSLAQSGGQLLGTIGLQAVGVPWFVTTGLTSYGSGLEEAYNEGADYEEASISAAVTAGAEILTEKISGGIKFGGKALDDGITQQLSRAISNKLVRYLAKAGMDMAGEGAEEVISGYASAIGKQLSYADDKTLGELFTKEEAMESFIGGAVLGGVSSGVSAVKGEVKGTDAVTGLNKQEQAVVEREYKNRIEGKDLTQKEKAKIYDDVISDMDKGYISTDTIEEVLGGESFKSYKETADSEDAIKQEYVELGKLTKPTLAQQTRFMELHEQIKDMKENSQRDALKSKLGEEVFSLAKGSRLEESYNERGRRSQAFEADLTQYEAKYQDTIKKAAESGILNNTRRTHDFVDMIAKISADKGVSFDFTNNERLKESGFAVEGRNVGGYVSESGVTLNIESSKSLNSVVGHEITHVLEGTEFYNEMQKLVIEYAKSKGDYQGRMDSLTGLYKDIKGANLEAELTADLVGDYLFTDPDFVKNLSVSNRNVFQKIWDEVKYLYKVATAGSKEARELAKVQRAFETAYRESGNKAGETKYSLSDSEGKQLSEGQQEYFKDSKVRDENGNLKVLYHGTPNGDFTVFRDGSYFTDNKAYADRYQNANASSISSGKVASNPKTFEVYLDIKKPFDIADKAARDIYINEYIKGGNALGINPYLSDAEYSKIKTIDWTEGEDLRDFLIENGYDYDGLVLDEGADGGYGEEVNYRGKSYVVFSSEQVKNTDNLNPTEDKDIRFSLSEDSEGKQLSEGQREYFKDSKMRDDEGNLKVMYHGSQDAGFHVFDPSMSDDHTSLFFVDRNDVAASYSGTTETYEAKTIRSAEDMNKFLAEIGKVDVIEKAESLKKNVDNQYGALLDDLSAHYAANNYDTPEAAAKSVLANKEFAKIVVRAKTGLPGELISRINAYHDLKTEADKARREAQRVGNDFGHYKVVEEGGKFTLLYKGDRVAESDTAQGIYEEFCWYEGVGEGDANYKVYLNLTNPLEVDAKGEQWNEIKVPKELQKDVKEAFGVNAPFLNTRQFAELANAKGYDGVIFKNIRDNGMYSNGSEGASTVAIAFSSEQVKSVANEKPTGDKDIRYSINGAKQKSYGRYNVYGKDIALEKDIAPVAEPAAEWAKEAVRKPRAAQGETIPQSADADSSLYTREPLEDIAPVDEATERYSVNDMFPDDLAPLEAELEKAYAKAEALEAQLAEAIQQQDTQRFEQLNFEWAELNEQIKAMEAEVAETAERRAESISDTDAPPVREDYAPVYEQEDAEPFEDRDFKAVGDRKVNAYMFDNPEVKPFFQSEAEVMLGELADSQKAEKWVNHTEHNGKYGAESYYEFGGVKRHTSKDIAYLLDNVPGTTYEKLRNALNAIVEDNGRENNALSKRIEFILDERLRKGYQSYGFAGNGRIPPNQEYIDTVNAIEAQDSEAFEDLVAHGDEYAPAEIAPYVPKARPKKQAAAPVQETLFDAPIKPKAEKQPSMAKATPAEQARAQVLTEEPETPKRKSGIRGMINNLVLDKGMIFEDLALKTGNRELQARWNSIRYAEGRAQRHMEKGSNSASGLKSIRDTVEKSGKTGAFYNYLYHLHNADRMTLSKRFKDTEDKPVFGYGVKAEDSKIEAAKLERVNPEFKTWAKDVYAYMNNLREMLVEGGVISRETANLWQEMYPHYVPIRRKGDEGLNINVALDTKRTGVNAPIKRATGGNRDILPLFDTMGQRTMQTYKAIAKNRFGVELKNILGTTIDKSDMDIDEAIEGVDTHEELLKKGENGKNPTFTVFENGEKVTFEITQEMYDSIKPASDALSYTNKALKVANDIRRGIITEYNPVFMFTNPIKDTQDVVINSQHPMKTYANYPKAIAELVGKKGQYYREYMENGGEQNTYFEKDTNTFKKDKKGIVKWLGKIGEANNFIERVPRMAEYIASRKEGRSIDVSMLDAARVTTNFAAGGDLTKALNRNGFTFLNASMQGAIQQVRNVREAKMNGLKGWAQLAAKVAAVGLSHELVNYLLWDDDEDYEELSDYVKRNYYVVAKYDDGKFVRIPKGRALAVIQEAFKQMGDLITGDDETDLGAFCELVISNLAPNNPLENHVFAPLSQALRNKTWYGEDLVPSRLQKLPAGEQFDESTDAISKWLGEKLNISPVKLNYLLDQYSGGVGDVLLPYITPEATREKNTILAPFVDKFTTDGVMNNQNVGDFYDLRDELEVNANSSKADMDDILMSKYMNSVNSELSELYAKKREIQNSEHLSQREKYAAAREVQEEIIRIAREALDAYDNMTVNGDYAAIGDRYFKQDDEGAWEKMDDDAVTKYKVTSKAGDAKYASDGTNHYRWYEPEAGSDAEAGWRKVTDKEYERQQEVCSGLDISPEEYWANREEYSYAYDNPGSYALAKACGGYEAYTGYSKELSDIHADKDEYGKSINGSRKEKVLEYINNLDADYTTKIILWKSEYPSDDSYNYEIINYLNGREDISESEMRELLLKLGFGVDSEGNISW